MNGSTNENSVASNPAAVAASFDCASGLTVPSGAGTEVSVDGGLNWSAASAAAGNQNWHTIPNTIWLNGPDQNSYARYRVKFSLFAGTIEALGPSVTVQVHADNAATVYVNTTQIGAQPDQEILANFQDPAESYSTTVASSFVTGDNYIYVDDHNFSGVSGVDFLIKVTCLKPIAGVFWEAMDSALDANPNTGGGQRIFPDKDDPLDPLTHQNVRVLAYVCPAMEGVTVYFKSFDIDDPSANSSPVDSNGSNGSDNRGTPKQGTLSATSAVTDATGIASVVLSVTKQPGDNFRVAASCDEAALTSLNDNNVPANNEPEIAGFSGRVSEMLTVWRRLWIEMDSMGGFGSSKPSPDATFAVGEQWFLNDPVSGQSTLRLTGRLPEVANFYTGGFISNNITGPVSFDIVSNTDFFFPSKDRITITGVPDNPQRLQFLGYDFFVRDDDDRYLPSSFTPPLPRLDLLTAWVEDRYKPAYIQLEDGVAWNSNSTVPTELNSDPSSPSTVLDDAKNLDDNADFWAHLVVAAYQGKTSEDRDPDTDPLIPAVTVPARELTAIYAEVVRDILKNSIAPPASPASAEFKIRKTFDETVAHEIGHPPGGQSETSDHQEGGLMGESATGSNFTPPTLNRFRNAIKWQE